MLVVDIDEVVLHHSKHLIDHLNSLGIEMTEFVHELRGELRYETSQTVLSEDEQNRVLSDSFIHFAHCQQPIPGSVETLTQLSSDYYIVFLSNVPQRAAHMRRERLDFLGLTYPFFANTGGKGRAVKTLSGMTDAPIFFIDDSLRQIENVKLHTPNTTCIQFTFVDEIRSTATSVRRDVNRASKWEEVRALLEV